MRGRTRIIIIAAGALLVSVIFYMFFIKSRQSELSDVKNQVTEAESETAQLQIELQQLQQLQENAPDLEAELQRIRQYVPKENEVPNFMFQVQDAGDESGVDFVQISPELPKTPAEDPTGTTLAQVRLTIGVNGGYFAVQDFIRRLYELDRAVRVDTMAVATAAGGAEGEGGQGAGTLTVQLTARIFFELPAGTAPGAGSDGSVPAPSETAPAPGTSPEATTPTDGSTEEPEEETE